MLLIKTSEKSRIGEKNNKPNYRDIKFDVSNRHPSRIVKKATGSTQ